MGKKLIFYQNIIQKSRIPFDETTQQESLHVLLKLSSQKKNISREENFPYVEQGGNCGDTTHQKRAYHQPLNFSKKDGRNRPVISLRNLNEFMPNQNFMMKGLRCLRNFWKEGDYMCKDEYFLIPLNTFSTRFVQFLWSGKSSFASVLKIHVAVLH